MDKNSAIVVSALIAFLGLLPSAAMSHSGGTDASGCHQNSKTGDYHCHTPKSGSSSTSSRSSGSSRRSRGFSGSSSGVSRSRGFSSYGSGGVRTYARKSIPGLFNQNYESNDDCKKFTFTEILSQADRGYVRIQCGQMIMSIVAH